MRMALISAGCVFATSVALAGCDKLPHQPLGGSAKGRSNFGAGVDPIEEKCPYKSPPTTIYKITIDKDFAMKSGVVTRALHAPKAGAGGEFDEDGDVKDTKYNGNPKMDEPTRLDIGTGLKQGQSAMIKIILADNDISFRTDDAAMRAGDPGGKAIFCHVKFSDDGRSVRFRVVWDDTKGSKNQGTYNIGLIVKDSDKKSNFTLPIFIDPGVDNNG